MNAQAPTPASRPARGSGKLKKLLLVLLALAAVLILVVAVFGPAIASSVGRGIAEREANKQISGKLAIGSLSLSWGGPQSITGIKLLDPQGAVVGEAEASVGVGLRSLATGGLDLGEVTAKLKADVKQVVSPSGKDRTTNLEEALRPPPGVAGARVPTPGAPTPGAAPASPEIRLPAGLAARIRLLDSELRYTGELTPGSGVRTVGLTGISAQGDLTLGAPLTFTATANTLDGKRAIQLDVTANNITQADGLVTLDKADGTAKIDGAIPAEYLELIAARGGAGAGTGNGGTGDEPARVAGHFQLKDGRLTLADPAHPPFIEVRVPASALASAGAAMRVDKRPLITLIVERLDVPVPFGRTGTADYRGAVLMAMLRGSEMTGTLALTPGAPQAEMKPFAINPFELRVGSRDFIDGFGVAGELKTMYAGADAGRIGIDIVAADLLDGTGAFRASGPGRLRGQFQISNVPTAILQPLAQDIDLAQVLGPTLQADIRAGLQTQAPGTTSALAGGSAGSTGAVSEATASPYISGTVGSEKTSVWLDMFVDADRLRTRNEGIKVESRALGYLARRFTPADSGLEITGPGYGSITMKNFEFIGATGGAGALDLSCSSADARIIVGELAVKPAGAAAPLELSSLDTTITFNGEKTPVVKVEHQYGYNGETIAALGVLKIAGLLKADPAAPGKLGISVKSARPDGTLTVRDIPSSLGALGGDQALAFARAALGQSVDMSLNAAPAQDGSSTVTLNLTSSNATGSGKLVLAGGRLKTLDDGLSLALQRPAEVLNAALNSGGTGARVTVDSSSALSLKLSGIDVALSDAGLDPATLSAKAEIRTQGMGVTLQGPAGSATGRAERVALDTLALDAVLDGKGGGDITLDSRGQFQGNAFTASGTIGAGGVLTPGGVDIRNVSPRGSIALKDVPTSLVALFDPEQAALVQAAAGGTINADIAALPSGKGLDIKLTSTELAVNTRAVIDGDRLKIGPTTASAEISPAAAETILALKAPSLTPRPALPSVAKLSVEASEITLPIEGPTRLGSRPLGVYRVNMRSDGDIIVNNAVLLGAGTSSARPLNVGVRGLALGVVMNQDPSAVGGELSAELQVFDPASPRDSVATMSLSGGTTGLADLRDASVKVASTAALDRWLGTPGLAALALGDTLDVVVVGQKVSQAGGSIVTAGLQSPKLRAKVAVAVSPEGSRVQPFDASWTLDPALADRYLFTGADGKPTARLSRPVTLTLAVRALTVGPMATPLAPGAFAMDLSFTAPGLAIMTPDGVEADMGNLIGRLASAKTPGQVQFEVSTPGVRLSSVGGKATAQAEAAKPLSITGTLENVADLSGALTTDRLAVTSNVKGDLPTPLLDALSGQQGALVDLLGQRVDTRIVTTSLSKTGGQLDADLTADNASAAAKGEIRAGVFVASQPVFARMTRITAEASKRFISTVIPILDKIEKTADDKPAVITATNLTAPLDNDMSKLNGDVVFDLGTVQFKASDFFGEILKATSNAALGKVGQKIPPFKAQIRQGVVTYERFTIPTGEFDLSTEGRVDLVKKKMKVTVWVPVLALADEITGALKVASLPGLRELSSIPLKISGDLDNPDTEIDFERLGKDIIKLPGDAAGGAGEGVEDILKGVGDLFKKKKRKK